MESTVGSLALKARAAFKQLAGKPLRDREAAIRAIRRRLAIEAADLACRAFNETGMGVAADKQAKIELAIHQTPGTEDLITEVVTNDDGMVLYELSAFGVVCAVHPATNPAATLINITISALAAGNAVIHCAHPRALETSRHIAALMNATVRRVLGIDHLIGILPAGGMQAIREMMNHPDVDMIVMTGSHTAVSCACRADKKVIGAGPANPPAIVDETANVIKAAEDIVKSASFDNNLMCVTEKAIVAVKAIADLLAKEMEACGAQIVAAPETVERLTRAIIDGDGHSRKVFDGRNAKDILESAGIPAAPGVKLVVVRAAPEHPFVTKELKMPVVPMVCAADFDEAMAVALAIEQGCHHTAMLHSQSIERLNYAARLMQTSVFVKNGPGYAGIGYQMDAPCAFAVATKTGEGTVTARHFGRRRRCFLTEAFTIR